MSWSYDDDLRNDAEFLQQFTSFLLSCISQRGGEKAFLPEFVPERVYVPKPIRSEAPMIFPGVIIPGTHKVTSNRWGAISAIDSKGNSMGIRPHECVVLKMCPNPHRRAVE
jgi:hypothetical protein